MPTSRASSTAPLRAPTRPAAGRGGRPEQAGLAAPGWVLGVLGASGGVGASVLTAALAGRSAAAGQRVCAVDACPWGGGLDLLLGLDAVPGARWADLTTMRSPRGDALLAELPGAGGCSVLSWDCAPPVSVPEAWSVLPALRPHRDAIVVDLPPPESADLAAWASSCDDIVLVVGAGLDCLRPARVVVERTAALAGFVARTAPGGVESEWVAAALGLPVLAEVGPDSSVTADLLRGRPVGGRGPVARAAEQLLAALMPLPGVGGGS